MKLIKQIIPIAIIITLMTSCASSRIVLSSNADVSKYKYVIFGSESSGDRELDDIIMAVQNQIAETNLKVLSTSNISYITVTFYDYNNNQRIAVVKSSGIGMTVSHDQNIALGAIRKKLDKLFKDN